MHLDRCPFAYFVRRLHLGISPVLPGPLPSGNRYQIRQILASGGPGGDFSGPGISLLVRGEILQPGTFNGESRSLQVIKSPIVDAVNPR